MIPSRIEPTLIEKADLSRGFVKLDVSPGGGGSAAMDFKTLGSNSNKEEI